MRDVTILDIGICSARVLTSCYRNDIFRLRGILWPVSQRRGSELRAFSKDHSLTCWVGGAWFVSRGGTCGVCVIACLLVKPAVSQLVKEFSALRANQKVHYRVRNSRSLAAILCQMQPGHRIAFYARSQNCEKRLLASSCVPFCPPAWTTGLPLDGFSWNLVFEDY